MRQSLPDLALELSMDGIVLHKRTAPGQWVELGASRIDAPDLGANLRAMRDMADTARGQNFRTQIWLPDEQVSTHNLLLTGETQKEREQSARDALSAITQHRGEDFTIVLGAPSVSGYTPVAAVLLQTLKEARVFAEDNGFRPVGFSSRQAPSGFDFTPAFTEPLDWGPLKRKYSFAAGLALALLVGGIGFRIADPYQIWPSPPQEIAAPSEMPSTSRVNELWGLALLPSESPASPATLPGDTLAAVSTSGNTPSTLPPAAQSGAQIAAPEISSPREPEQWAEVVSGPAVPLTPARPPLELFASTVDQIPARKSPSLRQWYRGPVAPASVDKLAVNLATATASAPRADAPEKITATEIPTSGGLPRPTITRAFPLDNLDAIIAASKLLAQSDITLRASAGQPSPGIDLAGTPLRRRTADAQFTSTAPNLTPPDAQLAAALPDIGPMASLRPIRRPKVRPADLRTDGEFESPIAAPEAEAPPQLSLVVPPQIEEQASEAAETETPPSPPLTDVAWLSTPPPTASAPDALAAATQVAITRKDTQRLSSPIPGDLVAKIANPAEPVTTADIAANTEPAPTPETALTTAAGQQTEELASVQPQEATGIIADEIQNRFAKYADRPPRPRPASIQQIAEKDTLQPTKYALLNAAPPRERPAALELKAAAARRAAASAATPAPPKTQDATETTRTASIANPTPDSVQRAATVENSFDRSKISLIGVYGTAAKRRALIRLPSGRFVRVETGDKFSGYQVASIGSSSVKLQRSGRTETLKMPK